MTSKAFDNVVKLNAFVSVKDYGAKGDGATDDAAAINAAIDAVVAKGGGVVYIPEGVYGFKTTQLIPQSNVTLMGQGYKSVLTFIENTNTGTANGSGISLIRLSGGTVDNFHVQDVRFDGSIGYPADSNTSPTLITVRQFGVYISNSLITNCSVTRCFFTELSGGSVVFSSGATPRSKNIRIQDNYFFKGAYQSKLIFVSGDAATAIYDVRVVGNEIDTHGPQYHYDASVVDYIASTDSIHVDTVDYCIITDNIIRKGSGVGIRVEQSFHVTVADNAITDQGQLGITAYLDCRNVSILGNTIEGWGRIPDISAVRTYSGAYYYPTEYVASSPVNPSVDSRFAVWPYSTASTDITTIAAYTSGVAMQPFRGFAALSSTHRTTLTTIVGNSTDGVLTLDGSSKYLYASDFGYTCVHPINAGTDGNNTNGFVSGNTFRNSRVYDVYQPQYMNPVGTTGANGGKVAFSLTKDTTRLIQNNDPSAQYVDGIEVRTGIQFPAAGGASSDVNVLDDYQEGSFQATLTVAGGSVTMGTDRTVQYTKIGRLVTLAGRVQLSNAATPSGEVAIETLPYTSSGSGVAACYIFARNVGTITEIRGRIAPGATKMVLTRNNAGAAADIGGDLTNTSIFEFSITYTAQV
jgi:hypothetical protein